MNIYGVSAGFILVCENFLGKKNLDPQEIFKYLSYQMGGDGKSIKKSELDAYISKIESGSVNADKGKLQGLKEFQKNWDAISKGKDSITFSDMSDDMTGLLLATMGSEVFQVTQSPEEKTSQVDAIYDYLTDYLGLSNKDDVKESDLTSYLNDIIAGSSNDDDSDSELIGTLINLIDSYSSNSTMLVEA